MSLIKTLKSPLIAVFLVFFSSPSLAVDTFVESSNGIAFSQLDFPGNNPVVLNSSVGSFEVNLLQLRISTGMQAGYLNVVLGGVWVVRNLPVFEEKDYPYPSIATRFDLGVLEGSAVSQLSADVLYSDDVKQVGVIGSPAAFAVDDYIMSPGGISAEPGVITGAGSAKPPSYKEVRFGDPENTRSIMQLDHPNEDAADRQCYPMAVANSMQYLADTTDLVLPHKHVIGLSGDDTLVGKIGKAMERDVTSRRNGNGVWYLEGIEGKLKYLAENNLQDRVRTRTWGTPDADSNHSVTVDGKTAVSTTEGAGTKLFSDYVAALEGGQACEAIYHWPGGAHAVAISGAGYTRGQPWIIYSSDDDQSSDTKGAHSAGIWFAHLVDSDDDGEFNLGGGERQISMVMCQEYIPVKNPPDTNLPPPIIDLLVRSVGLEVLEVTDPAGHLSFVDNPPMSLDFDLKNDGRFTLLGVASWLPLSLFPDGSGGLSGSNTATVAGFSNVTNTISATVEDKTINAKITLGANGGLPQGQPIVFDVRLTSEETWGWIQGEAVPVQLTTSIRANGFRHNFTASAADPLSIGVSLEPGAQVGTNADWWIVAQTGAITAYFDMATSSWVVGPLVPSMQGPLTSTVSDTLFRAPGSVLPPGKYTFYFAVDTDMNGVVDVGSLVFDSVVLTLE